MVDYVQIMCNGIATGMGILVAGEILNWLKKKHKGWKNQLKENWNLTQKDI